MSTKILVRIELSDKYISLNKKIELSFFITGLGVKYTIGTNFGGNISGVFSDILKNLKNNEIIFELTDDPMDVNADILFLGDGVNYFMGERMVDTSESLYLRMKRVQSFFEELSNKKNIKSISVDIDALDTFDYQEFEKIKMKVSEFVDRMVELFKQNDQITPTVRVYFVEK